MKKIFLTILVLAGIHNIASAQFATPTMAGFNSLHQSLHASPATLPEYKYYLALPHMDFGIHNNFALNDLFTADGDSMLLDLSKWTRTNSGPLQLQLNQNVRLLDVGFALSPKNYLYFGSSVQLNQNIALPTGLLQFAEVGRTLDMSGLNLNVSAWSAYHAGMVQQIGPFTLGIRYSILNGLANLQTVRSNLQLDMSSDSIQMHTDLEMRGSNLQRQDVNGRPLSGEFPDISSLVPFSKNKGQSLDIGLGYTYKDKLSLNLSLLNIGNSITWQSNLSTYTSNGQFHYTGPIVNMGVDSAGNAFQGIADTITAQIEQKLGLDTLGSSTSYTTSMTQQMLVHLNYRPYKFLGVGLIYRGPLNKVQLLNDAPTLTPYVDLQWSPYVSSRIHFSSSSYRSSLGGLIALRLWGVQLSAGIESVGMLFNQSSTRFFQFQGGLSLCFGKRIGRRRPIS